MSEYISVHQPNGLKTNWFPGEAITYICDAIINRTSDPDMTVKMYIPPGTLRVKAYFIIGFNADPGGTTSYASFCYGSAPTPPINYGNIFPSEFWAIDNFTQCSTQNGGYLYCVGSESASYSSVDPMATVGDWIYFNLDTESSDPNVSVTFQGSIQVDIAVYTAWYNTVQWDAYGDPLSLTGTTPTGSGYIDPYPGPWSVAYDRNNPYPFPPPF